ncbi:hypothetical protein OF83DRAFT_776627 [Amylostereum chailletii]|nr:hypothetical protein OF83DRAFT_776627 [Amylostereum chailletii]
MESQEKYPVTVDRTKLSPVLPSNIGRYDGEKRVIVRDTVLNPGLHTSVNYPPPSYSAHKWRISIHPEGKPYYHTTSLVTVVTEANIQDEKIVQQLQGWTSLLESLVVELGFSLGTKSDFSVPLEADVTDPALVPRSQDQLADARRDYPSLDLFLKLDLQTGGCFYYFVEHATRVVFWVDGLKSEDLGLLPSISSNHLKHALEENYWIHVEMFPVHPNRFQVEVLDDLMAVFMFGLSDQSTSRVSTFPYTKEECGRHLENLARMKGRPFDSHMIACIARLWSVMSNFKFITHHGEDHCRLSRNRSILGDIVRKRNKVLTVISLFLFNLPVSTRVRLEDLFFDGLVYEYTWEPAIREIQSEWLTYAILTLGLIVCNLLAFPVVPVAALAQASLVLCTAILIIAIILSQHYRGLEKLQASDAALFMSKHDTKRGCQALAIVFSLPKALSAWALVLFAIQMLWSAMDKLPLRAILPTCAALIILSSTIWLGIIPAYSNRLASDSTLVCDGFRKRSKQTEMEYV